MKIKTIDTQNLRGGNTIVVKLTTTDGKHGKAYTNAKAVCADGDTFDYAVGLKLATTRAKIKAVKIFSRQILKDIAQTERQLEILKTQADGMKQYLKDLEDYAKELKADGE